MELNQAIFSVMKKPENEGTKTKKKRLTFLDEVDAVTAEDTPRVINAKTTTFLTFGLCLVKSFSQQGLDIVGATYNSKSRRLVLADGKGLFSLDLVPSNSAVPVNKMGIPALPCLKKLRLEQVKRELCFQKYQFNLVRIISFSEKFNVYFALQKDFSIKVYNKNYLEVCSIQTPGSGWLTFISFNPVKDEVIVGGVKGVKIWKFKEKDVVDYTDTLFNYSLVLSAEYPHVAKKWCTNMDFDVVMQRFYCYSDSHFFCYDINGNMLLEIPNAHQSAILSCVYSSNANIFLTSSKGTEIKSWNDQGCLLHEFQGHTKAVTKILLHPINPTLFISASLDGSVKLWSFASMELFYSFSPFQDGILWMSTIEDKLLYCCTARDLHIYDLNSFTSFWAPVRSPISNLSLCSADGKSSRVVAMSIDNSLRIFSLHNATKLCTVLPPPCPSLLQSVLSFTYNRASGTVYLLLTPWDIWVYTARTDPACRAAVWTTKELQQHLYRKHPLASCIQSNEYFQHTRERNFRTSVRCECICSLSSPLCYVIDEGVVYADSQEFLVLGMQDGRILFLHTSIQNLVYYEMTVYKDPVIHLRHDVAQKQLIIMCQQPKCKLVHFRSLPALELVYCVDATNDTIAFTRLNNAMFVGMESGAVDVLKILNKDDQKAFSKKDVNNEKNEEKDGSDWSANYHRGAVVAVDSCKNLSIFLSCGLDFIIKLWDLRKKLIAEITLDNTLSTACFLNGSGDILLAFKNDLYLLPHNKILDLPKSSIDASRVLAAESFIFESQTSDEQEREKAVVSKAAEMEMESYLIPYKGFSFIEDFTSELLVLPKKEQQVCRLPVAPSKIYCSPCASEASLKIYDFLLQPRTPNLEEQDKAEMSKRMIVTKDMKYVPGPKVPPDWEIPSFGVSPCPSLVFEQLKAETKPGDQLADTESELSNTEFLQEATTKEQQQINEETASKQTAPEAPKIMPESVWFLEKKQILRSPFTFYLDPSVPGKKKEKSCKRDSRVKFASWKPPHEQTFTTLNTTENSQETSEIREPKKHILKKVFRRESLSIKKIRTPKHARLISAEKGPVISKDRIYVPCAKSAISVGEKEYPALESKDLACPIKRLLLSEKTDQKKGEDYASCDEKNIRVAAQRKKRHEQIQQAAERRLIRERAQKSCSRNHCFTPSNSQQYSHLESSACVSETLFTWMKPYRQVAGRSYTVMEETTINLPRDFPYRLAWETPSTEVLDIKLYYPKKKFPKDSKLSNVLLDKGLQPTKSIPDKGRYILVTEPIPESSLPALSPLENKLLSVRFPRQKEKILRSFLSNLQEPC